MPSKQPAAPKQRAAAASPKRTTATATPRTRATTSATGRATKASASRTKPTPSVTHHDIALRAHDLYVQSGFQGQREIEFWLEAERQLRKGIKT
jgi:hypothetical protein